MWFRGAGPGPCSSAGLTRFLFGYFVVHRFSLQKKGAPYNLVPLIVVKSLY